MIRIHSTIPGAARRAVALFMFVAGCAGAHGHDAFPPKTPIRPLFLWRVTPASGGTTAPSYLFGTCHAGVTLDRALPPDQRGALDGARVVALEVDMSQPIDPVRVMRQLLLPDDQSLRSAVGEESWRGLVQREPFSRMPWFLVDRFHPFIVTAALALASAGTDPAAVGLDESVAGVARSRGARITGLETIEDQTTLVQRLPLSSFVPSVRAAVAAPTEIGREMRLVFQVCATGDDHALAMLMNGAPDPMIRVRNIAWLPRVEALVHAGGAFVAVGAGHLVGPDGLVASLASRGYRAERISTTAPDGPGDMPPPSSGGASPSSEVPTALAPSAAPPSGSPAPSVAGDGIPRDQWLAAFEQTFAARVCGVPLARQCLGAEIPACEAQYVRASRFCVDEHPERIPPIITESRGGEYGGALGGCAQSEIEALERLRGRWEAMPTCADPHAWEQAFAPTSPAAASAQPTAPVPARRRR